MPQELGARSTTALLPDEYACGVAPKVSAGIAQPGASQFSAAWSQTTRAAGFLLVQASLFVHWIGVCIFHFCAVSRDAGDDRTSHLTDDKRNVVPQRGIGLTLRTLHLGNTVLGTVAIVFFHLVLASWKTTTLVEWLAQPASWASSLAAYLFHWRSSSATISLVIKLGCLLSGLWISATGNFLIFRTTSTISLAISTMQRSLERPQGDYVFRQPVPDPITTDRATATPEARTPEAVEMLREQKRQREEAERQRSDAKQHEQLRYWRREAQRADNTRRRAGARERDARQQLIGQLKRQQEELQGEARRQRIAQYQRSKATSQMPKTHASEPSSQTFDEEEEDREELSEEQARRGNAWKETYDKLTSKPNAAEEAKLRETAQKGAVEKVLHQDAFKAWSQQCKNLLSHPRSVMKMPEPLYTFCCQPGCSAPRYLKGCSHSVARTYKDAGLGQSELESELRFWHPDRAHFRQIPEPYKDDVLKMADEVFKALQPVVDAGRTSR